MVIAGFIGGVLVMLPFFILWLRARTKADKWDEQQDMGNIFSGGEEHS
jgi:hypothetical protein